MKRLLYLSMTALLLIFTSCQNESPISGPELSENHSISKAEPNWIGLPQSADGKLAKKFGTKKHITVAEGGDLLIDESYVTLEGKTVRAYSSITFAPGTVQNDVEITMEIDDQNGVSTFLPHQMFNFPAILNQTFTGLNLNGIDPSTIQLYYLATDGTYEVMEYDQLIVDIENGTITVVNGKIPHFSLYGFGV